MKPQLVSTLWPIDSKSSHIKMVRASVSHLIEISRLALRIARNREPHIRTMCGPVWSSDFERLSLDVLCKKLYFLLLHCRISTINYMYGIGLFHNRDITSIVVKAVKQRNEHTDSLAGGIIRRHCKYNIYY